MQLAPPPEEPAPRQPSYGPWLVALALLFCIASGGAGWWLKTASIAKAENRPQTGADAGMNPNIPQEFRGAAQQGKTLFENGDYLGAEKIYAEILRQLPDNHYVLSNLGVVYFRRGKYRQAEEVLVKATRIAPEDGFSHSTLGITYYTEQKLDDAVKSLGRAIVLNPNDAVAHNYLGITASSKGWQESAVKELETACTIDPNYADAHFNLAIVFSTLTPPNKEKAREYYRRAIELGAEKDSALEAMLK